MISECDKQMPLMVEQRVLMKDFFLMKWQIHPAGSGAHVLLFLSSQQKSSLGGSASDRRETEAWGSARK